MANPETSLAARRRYEPEVVGNWTSVDGDLFRWLDKSGAPANWRRLVRHTRTNDNRKLVRGAEVEASSLTTEAHRRACYGHELFRENLGAEITWSVRTIEDGREKLSTVAHFAPNGTLARASVHCGELGWMRPGLDDPYVSELLQGLLEDTPCASWDAADIMAVPQRRR